MLRKDATIGGYILLEKVGSGAFGDVWKAEKRTILDSNLFALKFFRPKDDSVDLVSIGKELQVWKRLKGLPHIISVIELDQYEDYVYVVSDFADGGSLEKYLNAKGDAALSEKEAVRIIRGILTGLESLHDKNIIHRDLKPDNILIMNGKHCLADFGVSREMKSQSKATGTAGTMMYMPPEAFGDVFSPQTDIWAVGVILQRMLTGRLPFPQDNQAALIGAIIQFDPEKMPDVVSSELQRIVARCLHKNPDERYESASEMKDDLRNWSTRFSSEEFITSPVIADFDSETIPELTTSKSQLHQKHTAATEVFIKRPGNEGKLSPDTSSKSIDEVEVTQYFGTGTMPVLEVENHEAISDDRDEELQAPEPQHQPAPKAQEIAPAKKSYLPWIGAGAVAVAVGLITLVIALGLLIYALSSSAPISNGNKNTTANISAGANENINLPAAAVPTPSAARSAVANNYVDPTPVPAPSKQAVAPPGQPPVVAPTVTVKAVKPTPNRKPATDRSPDCIYNGNCRNS